MATKDTVVQELVVNMLTHKQFKAAQEAGTLSPYELYGTPDTSVRLPVLTPMWFDHITNDVSWLRADTFSWHSGDVYKAAYEHLAGDYESIEKDVLYAWDWSKGIGLIYTKTATPAVGDTLYDKNGEPLSNSIIGVSDGIITVDINSSEGAAYRTTENDTDTAIQTDTIGDITITYYLAEDGHKICLADQEANITALYEATGVAWYYILDTDNKQFKLPRSKHNKYADTLPVVGNGLNLGLTNGTTNYGFGYKASDQALKGRADFYGKSVGTSGALGGVASAAASGNSWGVTTDPENSGVIATQEQDTDQYKYLYFYVGNFEQSAVEQTAGITSEQLNNKVDRSEADYVVESQLPTADNGYTWYRKYKSGWVEQGGVFATQSTSLTFPVEMADTNYCWWVNAAPADNSNFRKYSATKATTGLTGLSELYGTSSAHASHTYWEATAMWQVSGMGA